MNFHDRHFNDAVALPPAGQRSKLVRFFEALNHFLVFHDMNDLPLMAIGMAEYSSDLFGQPDKTPGTIVHDEFYRGMLAYREKSAMIRPRILDAIVGEHTGFWRLDLGDGDTLMVFAEIGDGNISRYYDRICP